jgi:hypothetical protein
MIGGVDYERSRDMTTHDPRLVEFDRQLAVIDAKPVEERQRAFKEFAREWVPVLREVSQDLLAETERPPRRVRGIFIGFG